MYIHMCVHVSWMWSRLDWRHSENQIPVDILLQILKSYSFHISIADTVKLFIHLNILRKTSKNIKKFIFSCFHRSYTVYLWPLGIRIYFITRWIYIAIHICRHIYSVPTYRIQVGKDLCGKTVHINRATCIENFHGLISLKFF